MVIDEIWAAFGYPDEIRGLIGWMPPEDGRPVGVSGIEREWREFVEASGTMFRDRPIVQS